ncbi:MAG: recombinase family protein [Limisphaerales bacterium]
MNPAILYARCSTDKQENSIAVQQAKLTAHLAANGLVTRPELTFDDEDVSGRIPIWKRKGGKQAVDILRQGIHLDGEFIQPKDIVITRVDRLGRSAKDILEFFEWTQQYGYTLHLVDFGGMNLNSGDPMGAIIFKMLLTLLGIVAEMEVAFTRQRIRDTFSHKRERGELCGIAAYGQRAKPTGRFTVKGKEVMEWNEDPTEFLNLQQMLRWHLVENLGAWAIAKRLNGTGITAKQGGKWSVGKVDKVLHNHFSRSVAEADELAPRTDCKLCCASLQQGMGASG